ncbi:MAG: hypothetical protein JRE64_03200 [Deltaproteobacteria bacterium]|nr:hypothetical protein [Deltaproteobacteria bacterium]
MEFVRVNEKLTNEGNNLTILPLKILQPLRDPYDALLVQPIGTMQVTEQRIGHNDQNAAVKLYRDLLNHAYEHAVDLVLTPEYCLPWRVVEEIVDTALKPKHGALWALGCESIIPEDLDALKARWEQRGIRVLYETLPQQNKVYLCPLVYIFWVQNADSEANLCMLIQFKSEPCGGTLEVDHLYLGDDVYVFGNGGNELNFFSLICADVFRITKQQIQEYHKDSLIAHIQLNQKPWHPDFTRYRDLLFSVGSNNPIELVCLNWATGVTWANDGDPDNVTTWSHVANSAFYIPKRLFQSFSDIELDTLHKKGIYYNRVHSQWEALFLNNAAQAILVRKQPIRFDGDQALALPWRLQYLKRFIPNAGDDSWIEANEANDGFTDLLAEYKPAEPNIQEGFNRFEANLKEAHDASPLAVERSLELLQGPAGLPSSWYTRYELDALNVAIEESPKRVTTHQENCPTRRGVIFRKRRLQASYDAATLYTQELNWPIPLKDIGQGFAYRWREAHPHCNVVPLVATENPATLIYLDPCIPSEAESYYKKMDRGLSEHAIKTSGDKDPVESVIRAKDRLCVIYRENHQYKFLHKSDGKKSITIPANQSPTSFDTEDDNEY